MKLHLLIQVKCPSGLREEKQYYNLCPNNIFHLCSCWVLLRTNRIFDWATIAQPFILQLALQYVVPPV
jgi:hypothetical protein